MREDRWQERIFPRLLEQCRLARLPNFEQIVVQRRSAAELRQARSSINPYLFGTTFNFTLSAIKVFSPWMAKRILIFRNAPNPLTSVIWPMP